MSLGCILKTHRFLDKHGYRLTNDLSKNGTRSVMQCDRRNSMFTACGGDNQATHIKAKRHVRVLRQISSSREEQTYDLLYPFFLLQLLNWRVDNATRVIYC